VGDAASETFLCEPSDICEADKTTNLFRSSIQQRKMPTTRNLPALVRNRFKSAQSSEDLTFFETRVSILHCGGFPVRTGISNPGIPANVSQFQLRFSPALANKPKSNKPSNYKPIDPFENPPKGLFLTDLPPSHFLVLNKFPVIPNHFILATKSFKDQTDPLEQDDLEAAYACLKAYRDNGEELFGFFNSGDLSGASQPHRHIQFLPVESMRNGIEESDKWDVLADNLVNTPKPGTICVLSASAPHTTNIKQCYHSPTLPAH
jgi:sulfate adenylyltransferase (ADP) / ATP adenylyltransferase